MRVSEEEAAMLARMPVLPDADGFKLHNPTQELQERFVGRSFEPSYLEGGEFVNYVTERAFAPKRPNKVLDFGCGWGRMSRLLLHSKRFPGVEFHGCDLSQVALDVVRRTVPGLWLQKTGSLPPSIYRDDLFDVVFAYSVFSHLSEESALAWGREFSRIMAVGGRLVVTTQGLHFLQFVDDLRSGAAENRNPWHDLLVASELGMAQQERYQAGEFLYAGTTPTPGYGEAVVPRSWFAREWGAFGFEMVEWEEPKGQNRCVMVLRS